MNEPPRTGTEHTLTFLASAEHTIHFEKHDLPPVVSTPALLWFMEHAALQLLEEYLDEGELSVGSGIDLEHLAPALEGAEIRCVATVVLAAQRNATFRVKAFEGETLLSQGLHRRQIVSADRLRKRLANGNG
ncbi:Fluoroacetyl-CoA thioesterase [Maioricimonas rarisocia]|uniref:Fluoroacetyl-CoA thioesterase n=1 Tax=Maioricimonas rarisocia TaxID=2528026 RepID=A0A517Z527_9PLAN|nr:thioesterase family protein [Maioricimonas rarisocia]QDU37588.1 Fluoroacetyl-CoA thioesterase [Maioricimonas rarisocia]